MAVSIGTPGRPVRLKFDLAFQSDARAHHVTRQDVERVLRWPKWVNELTAGANLMASQSVRAWVASPATSETHEPSLVLVVTRDTREERRVHDAWRLYLSDVELSGARSAYDVLKAFLERYGLDVQLGTQSRRFFPPCRIPIGPAGNTSLHIQGAEPGFGVRTLEVFRFVPERAEIEVGVAFAIDERRLRADLARRRRTPFNGGPTTSASHA